MTDSNFEEFWSNYPRKVAKGAARRKYDKVIKDGLADHETMMAGLERYKARIERDKTEQRFIVHASTWLHQERWEDEDEPAKPTGLRPDQIMYWEEWKRKGNEIPRSMIPILRDNGVNV